MQKQQALQCNAQEAGEKRKSKRINTNQLILTKKPHQGRKKE
jgi:hypothetical protein